MNKTLLMALLMLFALISCGGDNNDDDNDTPQQENTTGTSGTTGTTGSGGTTACLSSSRQEEVRTFFNEISDRDLNGKGSVFIVDGDQVTNINTIGTFRFTPTNENTWNFAGEACQDDQLSNCIKFNEVFSLRNGCFFVGDSRARVTSSSDTSISYVVNDSNGVSTSSGSVSSGKVRLRTLTTKNGSTVSRFNFNEI